MKTFRPKFTDMAFDFDFGKTIKYKFVVIVLSASFNG